MSSLASSLTLLRGEYLALRHQTASQLSLLHKSLSVPLQAYCKLQA
jgi:hypothetical protein